MTLRDMFRKWLGITTAVMPDPPPLPLLTAKPGPLKISGEALAVSGVAGKVVNAFVIPKPAPGVLPAGSMGMAQDEQINAAYAYAIQGVWGEGLQFMGYPYLAELTQRPEYRRPSETIAMEMTRKWIKLVSVSKDRNKADILKKIEKKLNELHARDVFRTAAEQDGFFGRAHIFIDLGDENNPDELVTPLIIDKRKIKKGGLKRLRTVEAMWVYPDAYNSSDPLKADYFKPTSWFVMGKRVSSSRLITIVSRDLPDIIKPAYSFGGLSLSQMAKPYVDNWLRTRQSVSDLIHSFAVPVLKTVMGDVLQGGNGSSLFDRIALFNQTRDNRGAMAIDKESEDFDTVSTPLSELALLQAQSQEHMAAVTGIPLTILLGITPSGLNASSEGEIRTFYGWVEAQQENIFREPLKKIIDIVQLSLFGQIDPDIGFQFVPLWTMSEKEESEIRQADATTGQIYLDAGVISAEEQREVLARQEGSLYAGIKVEELPDPPEPSDEVDVDDTEQPDEQEGDG